MEDKKDDFILILAGYSKEMDHFMSLNPGLPSRFPIKIDFIDYSTDELIEIAQSMLSDREYVITLDGERKLREYLSEEKRTTATPFSNGRFIRNLVEEAIRNQAVRLLRIGKYDRKSLATLTADDFQFHK